MSALEDRSSVVSIVSSPRLGGRVPDRLLCESRLRGRRGIRQTRAQAAAQAQRRRSAMYRSTAQVQAGAQRGASQRSAGACAAKQGCGARRHAQAGDDAVSGAADASKGAVISRGARRSGHPSAVVGPGRAIRRRIEFTKHDAVGHRNGRRRLAREGGTDGTHARQRQHERQRGAAAHGARVSQTLVERGASPRGRLRSAALQRAGAERSRSGHASGVCPYDEASTGTRRWGTCGRWNRCGCSMGTDSDERPS